MTFDEYQELSRQTALYPDLGKNFVYPTLGLSGEAGEVAEKIKKVIRDKGGEIDLATRRTISRELGDVLWYVANLATELGLQLGIVARENIQKLACRREKAMIQGEGDGR